MKIDFIIPYVNCDDKEWLSEFQKYGGKLDTSFAGGITRYKDEGTLKYLLRSIDKYTPWVNNVYLLVASKSQIPEYINRKTIKIIYHKDFIPEEYLPVFNSNHIETFMGLLYKIPNLSENIVWFNDDIVLNRPLNENFFFYKDRPCYDIKFDVFHNNFYGDTLRKRASQFILSVDQITRTKHGTISYNTNLLKQCWDTYDFINTLGKLHSTKRLDCNVNQYAYALYQWIKTPITLPNAKIWNASNKKMESLNDSWHQLCINAGVLSEENLKITLDYLQNKFPNTSKYELNISNNV